VAPHALVAASVGSYGAVLADGSEYRGGWDPSFDLAAFHAPRLAAVARGADLVACETIPSLVEALALARCLQSPGWISFSLRDGGHTAAGDDLTACARALSSFAEVVAIGINCCQPDLVAEALARLAAGTDRPLVAYPNSGERYDAHAWCGNTIAPEAFAQRVDTWVRAGARLVGGCCRTGPAHVAAIARRRIALP
jgi:homocysteine S-methyltransferase